MPETDEQEYCARCDAPVFPPETSLDDDGLCDFCAADDADGTEGDDQDDGA